MLTPTEAIAIAPANSSAQEISSALVSSSALAGLSAQRPPSLRESPEPSSQTLEPTQHNSHWLPRANPERLNTRNKTHSSLGKGYLRRSCAPSDDISLQQLCAQQCGRTNMRIYTQNTPNSARSHYGIHSGIHINLITINNTTLSHNSKHVRLLQECTLNNPDFPRHHRGLPPVKAAIAHVDLRDSLSDTESPSTNCSVHNIESPFSTNIRRIQSHVYDRYTYII